MSYTSTETAFHALITDNLAGYDTNNTKIGDVNAALTYSDANNTNACVIDYAGGHEDEQRPSYGNIAHWIWDCIVTFYLVYDSDTIETDVRSLVDNFVALQRDNKVVTSNVTWKIREARAFEPITPTQTTRAYVPIIFLCSFKEPI